jgi:hypothetical protein
VIKSRGIRWLGYLAHMGRGQMHTEFWWGDRREGDHLEDPGTDESIILKWIFKGLDGEGMDWIGLAWDRDR